MELRLIEIVIPADRVGEIGRMVDEKFLLDRWTTDLHDHHALVRVLVDAQCTDALLDALEGRFAGVDHFRMMLFPVEATIPRPQPRDEKVEQNDRQKAAARIGREELYAEVANGSQFSLVFLASVVLSTVVAAVGLMRDDVAAIIGAMVIAPLLGPHIALSLATTLADRPLAAQAFKTAAAGVVLSLILAVLVGIIFPVDPEVPAVAARTNVGLTDVLLALAAGSAGALAISTSVPVALTGVMVAVALLPPIVVFGLMLAAGRWDDAFGAGLLLVTNLICVNLAGVVTFVLQGVRPRNWWEADRARTATRRALCIWFALLAALVAIILFSQKVEFDQYFRWSQ